MNDEIGAPAVTASERAELEHLRAEVARLRLEQHAGGTGGGTGGGPGEPTASGHRARRWGRTSAAVVLILLGVLCAPLSVMAVWAKSQITDTNRYVETVAPLASDPAIQAAVTTQITNEIFTYLDVDGVTKDALTALSQADAVPRGSPPSWTRWPSPSRTASAASPPTRCRRSSPATRSRSCGRRPSGRRTPSWWRR